MIAQAQQGNITLKNSFTPESRRLLSRLEKSIHTLSWTVASAGILISGMLIRDESQGNWLSIVLALLALLFFCWGLWGSRLR